MNTIEKRVKKIVSEQLSVSEKRITPEALFSEDLGADSLDTVELVMALEEEFEIDIPDEDAEKIYCVGDVLAYLRSNITSKVVSRSFIERGCEVS